MKLLYFAWVRERVGKAEEQIDPPAGIATDRTATPSSCAIFA